MWNLLDKAYSFKGLGLVMVPAVPMLIWLVGRGVWTWTTAGYVEEHWSRVVLAGLIAFGTAQMFVTVLIVNLLRFHTARKSLGESERAAVSFTAATKTLDVAKPVRPSTPQEDELLAASR